jgi:hypothetical protein
MAAARQLRFDFLELGHHPLLRRFTPEDKRPVLPTDSTIMCEPEEGEGFRLALASLFPV